MNVGGGGMEVGEDGGGGWRWGRMEVGEDGGGGRTEHACKQLQVHQNVLN